MLQRVKGKHVGRKCQKKDSRGYRSHALSGCNGSELHVFDIANENGHLGSFCCFS